MNERQELFRSLY
jgi:hypothetical protein